MATVELHRRDVLRSLRASLVKKSKKHKGGGNCCASAFEKWHFAILRRSCEPDDDPLLPVKVRISDHIDAERVLKEELVAEGLSAASAEVVATTLRKQFVRAARILAKKLKRCRSVEIAPAMCSAAASDGLLTLSQGEARVQIHSAQFAKMKRLWAAEESGKNDEEAFLAATTRMLVRYQALSGGGFQVSNCKKSIATIPARVQRESGRDN